MNNSIEPEEFYVIGNNLALDFINSATRELTTESLVEWAIAVGLIEAARAREAVTRWKRADIAEVALVRSRLREIVVRLVETNRLTPRDVEWLNRMMREKGGFSELVVTPEGFGKISKIDLRNPKEINAPIIEAFVDMICYGQIEFIRKCERPDCTLYFYDTTKNHKRRWCSMAICGNRAKVAKFYERQRSKTRGKS